MLPKLSELNLLGYNTFIETGSYVGSGIQKALDFGFQKIYSIELEKRLYDICKKKFENDSRVCLYLGDSIHALPGILREINEKSVFWLDAHYSGPGIGDENSPCPLLEELKIIKSHHIKDHFLMIDDIRIMGKAFKNINIRDIIVKVLEINNKYKIDFVDSKFPKDVLVARTI